MKMPTMKTEIAELPSDRYRVSAPIKVNVFSVSDGGFRAAAPELGMWTDGFGETASAAVADLAEAIVAQRAAIEAEPEIVCSSYAQKVRAAFENAVIDS